mgnify:CR=1 FL=1
MNIALIPARCGSKSIKFKNIKDLCGKPLIYWNLIALEESSIIDEVYVATDCEEIKKVVESFNLSKVKIYLRTEESATDTASSEFILLEFLKQSNFKEKDYIFLVQATAPLTYSYDFTNAFNQLKKEKKDSLLTCVREKIFIWEDGKAINYNYKNRPRRQDFDGLLVETGAFYINTVKNIIENKNRLSGNISIYEMSSYQNIDIDEEDDWLIATKLMKKYKLQA